MRVRSFPGFASFGDVLAELGERTGASGRIGFVVGVGDRDAVPVYYYATRILLSDEIRLIRIDGIEPTTATIRSGEYPLVSELYAVLPASARGDDGSRLLRDWLATDAGRDTIEASDYVSTR